MAVILSPSNWRRTWGNISTYRAVPSVLEILVLNSVEIRATVRSWPQVSWKSRRHRDAGEHRLQRTAGRVLPDGMSERLALANATEDAGIERGAQNTADKPTAEGQQPRFVTCICSSYSAREGEAA